MIFTALNFIKAELEAYMVQRANQAPYFPGQVVDVGSIVLPNGEINNALNKHVTIMLIGIEEERREGKRPYFIPGDAGQKLMLNPPVELDLFILFLANSTLYETALHDLSDVIGFFQSNPVFDAQKYPALNSGVTKSWRQIDRLSFKIYNLTFEQQNNLWAMLGVKYIPNIVYKMNMLTMFDTKSKEKTPAITEINLAEN